MILIDLISNYFSIVTFILFTTLVYLKYKSIKDEKKRNYPPSPSFRLPVIGHMLTLAKYAKEPWEGFDAIRKRYGDIVYLRLGEYNFVLVSTIKNIKEVLLTKQDQFLNRPHFRRYKCVFGGNQDNALALCNWSDLQKQRRNMTQSSTIPRYGSKLFDNLDKCINEEILILNGRLNDQRDVIKLTKLDILVFSFNIFSNYLCSQRFEYEDTKMSKQIRNYDAIFWEINQAYPYDFLPWLCNFSFVKKELKELKLMCDAVRDFVEIEIVLPRHNELKDKFNEEPESLEKCKDFLEFNLLTHYADPIGYDWESSIYQLGDLIGGNSAVANLVYRLLGHLALNQQSQDRIHEEAKHALEHLNTLNHEDEQTIKLKHRNLMVYTDACIFETLRLGSSPIIPHVAMQNTTIGGYKMVQTITFCTIANLMLNYSVRPVQNEYHILENDLKPIGSVALKVDNCFDLILIPRI